MMLHSSKIGLYANSRHTSVDDYVRATGISNPTYVAALKALKDGLKSDDNYRFIHALWFHLWGSATACKPNFICTDEFELIHTGGSFNYSIHGTKPASGQWADTQWIPSQKGKLNDISLFLWSYDHVNETSTDMGISESGRFLDIELFNSVMYSSMCSNYTGGNYLNSGGITTDGLFISKRTASNAQQLLKNTTSLASGSPLSVSLPQQPVKLWTSNGVNFSTKRFMVNGIAKASLPNWSALHSRLSTFLTAVGALP